MLALGDAALTLCCYLGGELGGQAEKPGAEQIHKVSDDPILTGLNESERYYPALRQMVPSSQVTVLAECGSGPVGFRREDGAVYGFSFQVENNDPDGLQLLLNFAGTVCGCAAWWSNRRFIEDALEEIRAAAEDGEAVCAISGGVDSAVCAMLGQRALGSKLHCIFVDTGLLREGEADNVIETLGPLLNIKRIDARDEFVEMLAGVRDPKEKEIRIFSLLRAILRREVSQLSDVRVILQGTNYSDMFGVQHNVMELPSARVHIVEPVRFLFKDEIRRVAEDLGLPECVCRRQPFPSSGLALRILPEVTPELLAQLRAADAIFMEELESSGQNRRLWQYYAIISEDPIPGDEGTLVVLRAVQAIEGGAVAARLSSDLTERVTERILTGVPNVRRVLYDLTPSHSYGRVEWR